MPHQLEASRVAYPPRIRTLTVARTQSLSATMRRFTLTGDELEPEFPLIPLTTATHVKVVVPDPPSGAPILPTLGEHGLLYPAGVDLVIRDYTVRGFDAAARELVLDFVLHAHGPAGRWAIRAKPGDRLGVMGPRGYTIYPGGYARYILGADETALPALERWFEEAPHDAHIDAFILAPACDRPELPSRAGVTVEWLDDADGSESLPRALIDATPTNDGAAFLWAAAESGVVAPLRRHLRSIGFTRSAFDVSGYWRNGSGDHREGTGA